MDSYLEVWINKKNENPPDKNQPKLLDQVRCALRIKHYSKRTEEAYIHWI